MKHTFVFYGIVGSGKGTQVKLLQEYLEQKDGDNTVFVSTGNVYRKITSGESFSGKIIKEVLEKGHLLPNFLTNSIFANTLLNELKEESNIVCDGFPRTIAQSEALESAMQFYDRSKVHIINIVISRDEAIKRMKLRGRTDDTDEGIKQRFWEYDNNVIPSFKYFKGKDGYIIHEINGEQSVEEVNKEIMTSLEKYLN